MLLDIRGLEEGIPAFLAAGLGFETPGILDFEAKSPAAADILLLCQISLELGLTSVLSVSCCRAASKAPRTSHELEARSP